VLCAALNQKATFTGLRSLRIKESDRLLALQSELSKFGARLTIGEDRAELHNGCTIPPTTTIAVNSWQDHRIVMSCSLLSVLGYSLYFDQPEVVSKSYPAFWEDLAKFGFQLNTQDVR
jgi:3-phosphoshikimate 1-carboxyvinyltransferase